MLIKTEIDVSQGLALCDLLLRKVPYATNNALTRTARELVQVEREELTHEFQVRKQFILNRVQIVKWSRPESLWTRVAINRNVQGSALLLTEFEGGGVKEPEHGSEIAIPLTGSPARASFPQKVTPSLLYKALHMQKHTTANGAVQYKGDRRTFIIPGLGIFQRGGSGKKQGARTRIGKAFVGRGGVTLHETTATAMLYSFKSGVPLRAQMHFVKTARELVTRRFGVIWREEFAREIASRPRK